MGRGTIGNTHPGNIAYYELIEKHFSEYDQANNPDIPKEKQVTKTDVAKKIIQEVINKGGSFKKREYDGTWTTQEPDSKQVIEKVKQALRDAVRDFKKTQGNP